MIKVGIATWFSGQGGYEKVGIEDGVGYTREKMHEPGALYYLVVFPPCQVG